MIWRWDQGRTQYFNYAAIKKISAVLLQYNGADMQVVDSAFRDDLMSNVSLPFAPQRYTIKRNYKRVFECSLLATYIGNRLIVSDIARGIAAGDMQFQTVDGYLYEVERRFRYPFPAFSNYSDVKQTCYPFLAMKKMLFAKALRSGNPSESLTLDEIGMCLIANEVTGTEDLDFYWDLSESSFSFDSYSSNDQKRQVREMMAFIGQHSYLKYNNSALTLAGIGLDEVEKNFDTIEPLNMEIVSKNPVDDFMRLTTYAKVLMPDIKGLDESEENLENFTIEEGKKVFSSHFAIERSSALRKKFIQNHPEPVCDICGKNMHITYPWTENMLEVHHLKPLASFEDEHNTTLNDVVGLCPSCHRAVHLYYKKCLKENGQSDFIDTADALAAYNKVKMEVNR